MRAEQFEQACQCSDSHEPGCPIAKVEALMASGLGRTVRDAFDLDYLCQKGKHDLSEEPADLIRLLKVIDQERAEFEREKKPQSDA